MKKLKGDNQKINYKIHIPSHKNQNSINNQVRKTFKIKQSIFSSIMYYPFQKQLQMIQNPSKLFQINNKIQQKKQKQFRFSIRLTPNKNACPKQLKSMSSRENRRQVENSEQLKCQQHQTIDINQRFHMSRQKFFFLRKVGKGGFGVVWKIKQKSSGKIYALKQMSKIKIINSKSISNVLNQRKILENISHTLIIPMRYAFQDSLYLYLVMEYINYGDLRLHLCIRQKFSQSQTIFFIACLMNAVQYLHSENIIHRDIKPQNLIFDKFGYLYLTDFGISHQNQIINDTSGTPGYMAPQSLTRGVSSCVTDYYSIGILAYQCMTGERPFLGKNRNEIKQKILIKEYKIEKSPAGWSKESINFMQSLMKRKPQERLGYKNGIQELKNHKWFKGFDWKSLSIKRLVAPFLPGPIQQNMELVEQALNIFTPSQDNEDLKLILKLDWIQQLFQGYEYNIKNRGQQYNNKIYKQKNDELNSKQLRRNYKQNNRF